MEKSNTEKKLGLLQEIEFGNDFALISQTLLKWKKQKPTELLDKIIDATIRMYYYTFNMQEKVRLMESMVSEYRQDKCRAVERARKAEKKIETLEKKQNLKL